MSVQTGTLPAPGITSRTGLPSSASPGTSLRAARGFLTRVLLLLAALAWGGWLLPTRGAEPDSTDRRPTLFYIPHTHWEGAVFKTREEYLEMGLPHILKALALLKANPDFKFTLDQVAYIKPFLERYPEAAEDFHAFVRAGRLGIVGGMDVMPDDVKPGGELFIRQMQYGQRYCRQTFGRDVTVAWLLDSFGHHPQLPQLLRQAGYHSFWFCRGVPRKDMPSEFLWQGLDGTRIPAVWLPGFYGLFYGPPRELPGFARFFQSRFESLSPHAAGNERVGLAGVDVSEPEEYVPPLVREFNVRPDRPFTIRYAVPTEFEAVVSKRADLPVISADMNPIFPGTYSSRPELKQLTRTVEAQLLTAEKLGVLAQCAGSPGVDQGELWRAWEPILFNQAHDLASGVMTDHVYEDTVGSYEFSRRLGEDLVNGRLQSLISRIDTRGEGLPVVVVNTLGWVRSDVAEVDLGFTATDVGGIKLVDAQGQDVPVQFDSEVRYDIGGLKHVRAVFLARDIPALGYTVYRVLPQSTAAAAQLPRSPEDGVLENEYLRAAVDARTGAITSLVEKSSGWEALGGPANVIAREPDHGDLWELYRGLDGASYLAGTNRQAVPARPTAQLSTDQPGTNGVVRRGPVFSEIKTSHPFANGSFSTRVRVCRGLNRVEIETDLVNHEKYVRYQALVPTSIRTGRYFQEIPFGAVERPAGIEFPAQHWADWSDDQHGVAVLNCGSPGNLVSDGTLLLSLLRSENLGHYGYGGGYEPGMSSESGFELGRPLSFRYAILPHKGDWQQARVYRAGLELNHPLLVRKAGRHEGKLPQQWGLFEVTAHNAVLTALEPGPGGTFDLRMYEAEGKQTPRVRVRLHVSLRTADSSNLHPAAGDMAPLGVQDNAFQFDLHPFEIKTVRLTLGKD